MTIIVDTNIIFSAILNVDGNIGDILLNSANVFQFIAPQYLDLELKKHNSKLSTISGIDIEHLSTIRDIVLRDIDFVSEENIPHPCWIEAESLVGDIDINDIAFVALALFVQDSKIWTGDKKLKKGLDQKGFKMCFSTLEMLQLRDKTLKK